MAYGLKGIEKLLSDLKEKEDKLKQKVYNNKVGYAPKCKVFIQNLYTFDTYNGVMSKKNKIARGIFFYMVLEE